MTNAQKILLSYLTSRGILASEITFLTTDRAEALGKYYTVNIYGDIMDGKGKVIADAEIEHTLCSLGTKIPTSWIDR